MIKLNSNVLSVSNVTYRLFFSTILRSLYISFAASQAFATVNYSAQSTYLTNLLNLMRASTIMLALLYLSVSNSK